MTLILSGLCGVVMAVVIGLVVLWRLEFREPADPMDGDPFDRGRSGGE